MASHQVEESADVCVSERENYSPTSVLSAAGSDNLEIHKSRLSPASCATDDLSALLPTDENDDEHVGSDISCKEEDGFQLPVKASSALVPDNEPTVVC